jgi:hypothetical protein
MYGLLIVSAGLLFYLWNATNPATINPIGILGIFVLLYFFWLSVFFIVLHISFLILRKTTILNFFIVKRHGKPFREGVAYYVASILAFMPVLILAMQSVNQLTIRDILLVLLFVILAVFYIIKRV